jgi:hypothetical protein
MPLPGGEQRVSRPMASSVEAEQFIANRRFLKMTTDTLAKGKITIHESIVQIK